MKYARWGSWAAELDGQIYAIGGFDQWGFNVAPIEVYNPATDAWIEKGPTPVPRDHLVVAAVNGKIYAIGGRGEGVNRGDLVHEYDPNLDVWQEKAPMPTPRSGMMVAVVNQKIHVIGGEGWLTPAHEIYDPQTDTWEIASPMPTARSGLAGGVVDNRIYAIGGHGLGVFAVNEMFIVPASTGAVAVEPRGKRFVTFGVVKQTALLQNYPNPFNPETWLPFQLHHASEVAFEIYDAHGQLVRQLHLGYRPAGGYLSREKAGYWDGRNQEGKPVSSGVYFYTLQTGDFSATRKMTLMK